MAEFGSDAGPALILETTLSDNDMRALQIWSGEILEKERERCAKIVQEAGLGGSDKDIRSIIDAIRFV